MNIRLKKEQIDTLQQENSQLKSKIQRSKPILQTIYDKVKRKQKLLYDKIFREKRLITQYKNIAKDFRKLYQQSIQMMSKNKLANRFDNSKSNFLETRPNKKGQNNKSLSVYQQYKQRINKSRQQVVQKNPQIENLKIQNKKLINNMLKDIQHHKLARQKSQKSLKKSKSNRLVKVASEKQETQSEQYKQYKKRLLQKQRQKLYRIK